MQSIFCVAPRCPTGSLVPYKIEVNQFHPVLASLGTSAPVPPPPLKIYPLSVFQFLHHQYLYNLFYFSPSVSSPPPPLQSLLFDSSNFFLSVSPSVSSPPLPLQSLLFQSSNFFHHHLLYISDTIGALGWVVISPYPAKVVATRNGKVP